MFNAHTIFLRFFCAVLNIQKVYMKLFDYYKEIVFCNDNFIINKSWAAIYYGVFSKVINDNNFKNVAEIGVGYGTHAKQILKNTNLTKLYLIDPMKDYPNDAFSSDIMSKEAEIEGNNFNELYSLILAELQPWNDKITFLRKCSTDVTADEIPDYSLDCIFIDGAHDFYNVYKDLNFWWKKLRVGGQLLGDDYWQDGVKMAVDKFFNENNIEYDFLYKDNESTYKIYRAVRI